MTCCVLCFFFFTVLYEMDGVITSHDQILDGGWQVLINGLNLISSLIKMGQSVGKPRVYHGEWSP